MDLCRAAVVMPSPLRPLHIKVDSFEAMEVSDCLAVVLLYHAQMNTSHGGYIADGLVGT
jgi:hypothetical protein